MSVTTMRKLDTEEPEILEAYQTGSLKPAANAKALIKRHQAYAAANFAKDACINIRISSKGLRLIQKRALSEGLPYQTMIASLLHKYVEGRLIEQG